MQVENDTNDFSEVKKALEQNEAPSRMRIMVGQGIRASAIILALGVAVSAMALSIGKGIQFLKDPKIVEKSLDFPKIPPLTPAHEGKVVRDYVIFQNVDTEVAREKISIVAGHNFKTSKQRIYDTAFCYTILQRNGLAVRVELSSKIPDSSPFLRSDQNLTALKMSGRDIREMQNLCPYL